MGRWRFAILAAAMLGGFSLSANAEESVSSPTKSAIAMGNLYHQYGWKSATGGGWSAGGRR